VVRTILAGGAVRLGSGSLGRRGQCGRCGPKGGGELTWGSNDTERRFLALTVDFLKFSVAAALMDGSNRFLWARWKEEKKSYLQ
jgi:hypothetical protein